LGARRAGLGSRPAAVQQKLATLGTKDHKVPVIAVDFKSGHVVKKSDGLLQIVTVQFQKEEAGPAQAVAFRGRAVHLSPGPFALAGGFASACAAQSGVKFKMSAARITQRTEPRQGSYLSGRRSVDDKSEDGSWEAVHA